MLASSFADNVLITDGNDIVVEKLLQPNVTLSNNNNVSCQKLVWGDGKDISNTLTQIQNVDVIIAADVVQWPAVIEPLLLTMKKLLSTSKKRPICILGIVARNNSTYNMFFEHAKRIGFVNIHKIEYSTFLEDGVVPLECRENHREGCSTEIYTLELQLDSDESLDEFTSDDLTIGKEYQYTCSLPC